VLADGQGQGDDLVPGGPAVERERIGKLLQVAVQPVDVGPVLAFPELPASASPEAKPSS
jgi:hypothetical protein